ncbi:sigma-70 family RNA polymerase sigma factor [Roseiconus nitratireducens]|uniref:Sigma-70 family RNA polymerase sigma factor n=1 Tax=Roseiconus nitratireducens TaxID=2605748 RepID=A0A5M6CY25_9BACT|nr:sigma-70 family RNA polymerase sigma factor [Roseiconus nitratireducens]KAA5539320.1 sigma-70 family RNA polymerase sigma factor [Roseiconus nitratireducens]
MEATDSRDNTILQRIARGDVSAVDDCLKQYGGLVWTLASRHCSTADDAEDASQEIFVELWRKADRFDPDSGGEATFVALIARRRLIDRHRRGQTAPDVVSINEAVVDLPDAGELDRLELSEEAAKAARCMKKLSDKERRILALSIYQGTPHSSIASFLEMPLGTVKSCARRGLLQLRECMKRPLSTEAAR